MKSLRTNLILLPIIIIFVCFASQCTKNNVKKCSEVNKIDLMLSDVLKKRKLFPLMRHFNFADTLDNFYITSNGLIKLGKRFYMKAENLVDGKFITDSVEVVSVERDKINLQHSNVLYVYIKETNIDSTDIKIVAGYSMNNRASAKGEYQYTFNNDSCKLEVKELDFWQY